MANLGDKLTVGDSEGVIVRSVAVDGGVELTVRVGTDRPVGAPTALPANEAEAQARADAAAASGNAPTAVEPSDEDKAEARKAGDKILREEQRRVVASTEDDDAPASQPQTGDDKPLGDAPASQKPTGDDKPLTKAPAKGTGNKAAGSK